MDQPPFFFRDNGILYRININEIQLIETSGNYIRLYSHNKTFVVRVSLEAALKKLPKNLFVQIHRSIVASVKFITAISKETLTIDAAPDKEFPISKTYYAGLMEKIRIIEAGSGENEEDKKNE